MSPAPGSLHPAYLAAPEKNQWRSDLKALWRFLEKTADEQAPHFAAVILPHGCRVALRRPGEGPRELVLYRREPFSTKRGESLWTAEVSTFRREFGILHWQPEQGNTKEGGPQVTFRETVEAMDFFGGSDGAKAL